MLCHGIKEKGKNNYEEREPRHGKTPYKKPKYKDFRDENE